MVDKLNTYPSKPSITLDYRDLKDQTGSGWKTCIWCGGENKRVELKFKDVVTLPLVAEVLTGGTSGDTGTVTEIETTSGAPVFITDWSPMDPYIHYANWLVDPGTVACDGTNLTEVASLGTMTFGTWYYNSTTKHLYVWLTDSSDPDNHQIASVVSTGYIHLKPYTGVGEDDNFCFEDGETVTGSLGASFTADGDGSVKNYSIYWPRTEMTFYEGKWYCNKHFKMVHGGLKQKDKSQVYIDERRDDQWR